MFLQVLLGGVVGIASGMRHAMEPDHLAAVSTLATEAPNTRGTVRFAVAWGFGHALMLLLVSSALLLTRREMPLPVIDAFEFAVAITLVGLGVRALLRVRTAAPHAYAASARRLTQPLLVGVLHGLAGSGAITALALSTLSSPAEALLFVALYGFGATLGMAGLAGLAGPPLSRLARRGAALRALVAVTGGISLFVGVVWGAQALGRLFAA